MSTYPHFPKCMELTCEIGTMVLDDEIDDLATVAWSAEMVRNVGIYEGKLVCEDMPENTTECIEVRGLLSRLESKATALAVLIGDDAEHRTAPPDPVKAWWLRQATEADFDAGVRDEPAEGDGTWGVLWAVLYGVDIAMRRIAIALDSYPDRHVDGIEECTNEEYSFIDALLNLERNLACLRFFCAEYADAVAEPIRDFFTMAQDHPLTRAVAWMAEKQHAMVCDPLYSFWEVLAWHSGHNHQNRCEMGGDDKGDIPYVPMQNGALAAALGVSERSLVTRAQRVMEKIRLERDENTRAQIFKAMDLDPYPAPPVVSGSERREALLRMVLLGAEPPASVPEDQREAWKARVVEPLTEEQRAAVRRDFLRKAGDLDDNCRPRLEDD